MGAASGKNFPISGGAASDLGLGDQVVQQLQDQDEERKKKMLSKGVMANNAPGLYGDSMSSPAVMSLLGQGMGKM
jgi:hypothetical protein